MAGVEEPPHPRASSRRPGRRAAPRPARRRAGRTARHRPGGPPGISITCWRNGSIGDRVRCGGRCRRGSGFPSWARYVSRHGAEQSQVGRMSATQTAGTVDAAEVAKFEAMAAEWWDPDGKFKPLHMLQPLPARLHRRPDRRRVRPRPEGAAPVRRAAAARHRLRRRAARRADGAARRRGGRASTPRRATSRWRGCTPSSRASRSTTATAPPRSSRRPASASTWC